MNPFVFYVLEVINTSHVDMNKQIVLSGSKGIGSEMSGAGSMYGD